MNLCLKSGSIFSKTNPHQQKPERHLQVIANFLLHAVGQLVAFLHVRHHYPEFNYEFTSELILLIYVNLFDLIHCIGVKTL